MRNVVPTPICESSSKEASSNSQSFQPLYPVQLLALRLQGLQRLGHTLLCLSGKMQRAVQRGVCRLCAV